MRAQERHLLLGADSGLPGFGAAALRPPACAAAALPNREAKGALPGAVRAGGCSAQRASSAPPAAQALLGRPAQPVVRPARGTQILHHRVAGYYVLMFHLDTPNFEVPAVGVATSATLTGARASAVDAATQAATSALPVAAPVAQRPLPALPQRPSLLPPPPANPRRPVHVAPPLLPRQACCALRLGLLLPGLRCGAACFSCPSAGTWLKGKGGRRGAGGRQAGSGC